MKRVIIATVTMLLATLLATSINIVPIVADLQASATVFVDPPTIKGKMIGENVTVNINVSNVTDLYGWQAGMTFDPNVLNCTGYYEGEFLKRADVTTLWLDRTPPWNNTKGIVYFHGCCLLGPVSGVNGSGQLGYLTFKVIGTGVSDLHLTDVILADSNAKRIQHELVDIFTISWGGVDYSVETISNLTGIWGEASSGLSYHAFRPQEKKITFNVATPDDNFYHVTIPNTILSCDNLSDWTVEIDGEQICFTATESPTDTSLYFTYHNSTHKVEITGTVLGKPGDLNDDGTVDIFDLVFVALHYGAEEGKPPPPDTQPYDSIADLNKDGVIDIFDLVMVGMHYGATYT